MLDLSKPRYVVLSWPCLELAALKSNSINICPMGVFGLLLTPVGCCCTVAVCQCLMIFVHILIPYQRVHLVIVMEQIFGHGVEGSLCSKNLWSLLRWNDDAQLTSQRPKNESGFRNSFSRSVSFVNIFPPVLWKKMQNGPSTDDLPH